MGIVRSWLFRFVYPLPQKDEDLLAHKETFIEEYTGPSRLKLEIKEFFVPHKKRENVYYVKMKHDKEQKAHAKAYRIWQNTILKRGKGRV